MATFKDKVTDGCALAISLATVVGTFAVTMNLPPVVLASCALVAGIAGAVTAWYNGKGDNGKPKKQLP